jgi:hypothetical protein
MAGVATVTTGVINCVISGAPVGVVLEGQASRLGRR